MAICRFGLVLLLVAAACVHATPDVDGTSVADNVPGKEPVVNEKLAAIKTKLAVAWKPFTAFSRKKGTFLDQFPTASIEQSGWTVSEAKKTDGSSSYDGTWSIEMAASGTHAGDYALVLKDKAKHHAISILFDEPLEFAKKNMFVVQYEVKLQEQLDCGGSYVKLFSQSNDKEASPFDPKVMHDMQPFTIMFGPDKCGSTNKVHFIFRHKNKKTGKIQEHHLRKAPTPQSWENKATHLYRLIVYPEENRYEVSVDDTDRVSGSLLGDEFEPPVEPLLEISDPEDKKPESWDENERILDPNPENYNEKVPKEIADETDTMPADWSVDEPLEIEEKGAVQPADWDTEIEGEWVRPRVPNPKCESGHCGEWNPRMKLNPEFKPRKMIPNPDFKGFWAPRKIPNPDYFSDKTVGQMVPVAGIGFELWTLQNQMAFDNILVSNSISMEELEVFTAATWKIKHAEEKELAELIQPNTEQTPGSKGALPFSWKQQLAPENIMAFFSLLITSPRRTWDLFPALLGITAALTSLILFFLVSLLGSSKKKTAASATTRPKASKKGSETDESEECGGIDEKLLNEKTGSTGNLTRRNPKSKPTAAAAAAAEDTASSSS